MIRFSGILLLSVFAISCADVEAEAARLAYTPSHLACGWAPSGVIDLEPAELGKCWRITPPPSRALGADWDGCAVTPGEPYYTAGGRVCVFGATGGDDAGEAHLMLATVDCPASYPPAPAPGPALQE